MPFDEHRACGFPSLCTAFTWCALASAYSGYVHGHASVPLSLYELVDALDKRSLAHRVVAYSRPELSVYTSVRRQKFASTHPALRDSPHRSCLCMRRQADPHTSVCVCVCVCVLLRWVCFCVFIQRLLMPERCYTVPKLRRTRTHVTHTPLHFG